MCSVYGDLLPDEALIDRAERTATELTTDLSSRRTRETVIWLVCIGDGRVLGSAQLLWGRIATVYPSIGSTDALLNTLYVDPERWGEGIGTHLVACGRAALPAGIDRLTVGVFPQNTIGHAFYRSHGFETIGKTQVAVGGTRYEIDLLACEC